MVVVPAGWIAAYEVAPIWHVNAVVAGTCMVLPYAVHHGCTRFLGLLPRTRVVSVQQHTIPSEYVDGVLDDVMLAEQEPGEDLDELEDFSGVPMDDIVEMSKPRRRRKVT
jgi:hypothetical protein